MKYVVCIPDGCADRPVAALGGLTPLEAARTPVLDRLASRAELGRARVIPAGMPPGSDVGVMSILGFDPTVFHTGRAPLEAAGLGIDVPDGATVFRGNLVVSDGSVMGDPCGGEPSDGEAASVLRDLNHAFEARGVRFWPGRGFRHVVTAPAEWEPAIVIPPHDLVGAPLQAPQGVGGNEIWSLFTDSEAVVTPGATDATHVWLWGQGRETVLPQYESTFGLSAAVVTAVDLVRGLASLAGMPLLGVEGATGACDTNYEGKRDAVLDSLAGGVDLVVLHVEATDDAGHAGDVAAKVGALEDWDARVLDGLVEGLDDLGSWRMLWLPDHATPVELRTHTHDTVPYMLFDSTVAETGGVLSERSTEGAAVVDGHDLMSALVEAR